MEPCWLDIVRPSMDVICTQQQHVKLPAAAIDGPSSPSISLHLRTKRIVLSSHHKSLCRRSPLITNKPVSALAVFEL